VLLRGEEGTVSAALVRAGELAALEMERLWQLDIIDPKIGSKDPRAARSLVEINRIIVRNGWGKPGAYKGNGPPQWCGMAAGDAWATAGMDPRPLAAFWASTLRLITWARYRAFNGHANATPPANVDDRRMLVKLEVGKPIAFVPRRGDVIIVGDGKDPAGDHINVNMGFNEATRSFDTISGNGGGVGPNGDTRDFRGGVSRREYFVDKGIFRAMWAVRPSFADLLAERG
jgi:hypothetical protein